MAKTSKRGDHVEWNSEAGRVRETVMKRVVSDTRFKGYVHHASKDEPQYIIKSDKTDHIAIHKGTASAAAKSTWRSHIRAVQRPRHGWLHGTSRRLIFGLSESEHGNRKMRQLPWATIAVLLLMVILGIFLYGRMRRGRRPLDPEDFNQSRISFLVSCEVETA